MQKITYLCHKYVFYDQNNGVSNLKKTRSVVFYLKVLFWPQGTGGNEPNKPSICHPDLGTLSIRILSLTSNYVKNVVLVKLSSTICINISTLRIRRGPEWHNLLQKLLSRDKSTWTFWQARDLWQQKFSQAQLLDFWAI